MPASLDKCVTNSLIPDQVVYRVFAHIHQTALGLAVGTVTGVGLLIATLWLIFKGGPVIGPTLSLLGQFFPGYEVSITGAFLGLAYGLVAGFLVGWTIAFLRNRLLRLYLTEVKTEAELEETSRLMDRW